MVPKSKKQIGKEGPFNCLSLEIDFPDLIRKHQFDESKIRFLGHLKGESAGEGSRRTSTAFERGSQSVHETRFTFWAGNLCRFKTKSGLSPAGESKFFFFSIPTANLIMFPLDTEMLQG
jgi:hypothetical protein